MKTIGDLLDVVEANERAAEAELRYQESLR
jgi:hypothetical protein